MSGQGWSGGAGPQGSGPWSAPPQGGLPPRFCHACGAAIDPRAEICPRCGVRQAPAGAGWGKDRALTILLALLLGNFGVHRFYLGDVVWGIVYLVFFWTGIPGIVAWFEALYFLIRSDADWARDHGGPVRPANGLAIGCLWIVALWPLLAIVALAGLLFVGGAVSEVLSEVGNTL